MKTTNQIIEQIKLELGSDASKYEFSNFGGRVNVESTFDEYTSTLNINPSESNIQNFICDLKNQMM